MKLAIWKSQPISLNKIARERYQQIYELGQRYELTCSICSTRVKMYLGIYEEPHFYPVDKSINHEECERKAATMESPIVEIEESASYLEQNGFRIPKSRSISTQPSIDQTSWKAPKYISNLPIYLQNITNTPAPESPFWEQLLKKNIVLDFSQREAVKHVDGPLLVLAGAGSGKTRVLTTRVAYMIGEQKIDPRSIMLVTFTAKAAQEMKERLSLYTNRASMNGVVAGTFHSIFYRIVSHHEPSRWNHEKLLKWEWQKEQFLKQTGRSLGLDEKEFPWDEAIQMISYWKNNLQFPNDIKASNKTEEDYLHLYKEYEQWKKTNEFFDFDDMLIGCYELFTRDENLLQKYQQRFQYFLIDEFQDINKVQYETIKLLAKSKNLCVVGDDDQSIYAFRGSDPSYIVNFDRDFPTTKVVTLSENYRSTHAIVASANKVIAHNKKRKQKSMNAQVDNKKSPLLFFPHDEEEEATMIVQDMKERIENGDNPNDFAILYRTHSAARAIFERLTQSGLPFSIDQDYDSFYNRRIVKSMIAFLRLSHDKNDVKALTDILPALFLKQSSLQDAKAISILEDCDLAVALSKISNIAPFQAKKLKKLVPLFSSLQAVTPTVALEIIEKDMGFSDYVKKRGNEGNMVEKGSDDVRDLKVVAKKFSTVEDFLAHIDDMIAKTTEMKKLSKQFKDAIRLSTIHRAKGLEYKKVYILSVVDGGIPHDFALEDVRNGDYHSLEEERRLLYVAMTRAKEELFLSVPQNRRGKKAYLSRFIKQILPN
ncbi:ATP-dependent helicase [Sutcliffiella cohnii]|uniref:DNA 3'-5' helicase n=1 Tax=Sutcliffiella cohnii TaxID=33932 RepID=A0A223KMD6_9BACI|nr:MULTISPECIES: ATP-dependent helicase [Sutcliffiella]AST90670.1 ATP-dependent DNA helicase Rep [Sutcliffiella cohnii]WBL16323.1 ATP-dependent helicase [Sutcliffiella sp. NC1]